MFQPSFRIRRLVSLAVTLVALLLVALIAWIEEGRFGDASMLTGFTLLSTVLLLMLIGARRRLPVLRLGSMSTWTQCHLYLGLFSVGVFWMHVPTILGNGLFEGGLSLLFLLVSGSGVYGIYASRALPKRLTVVEGQHRFDRVSWHRHQIAEKASELLGELSEPAGDAVLGSFYTSSLNPFFNSRPSLAYVMVPSGSRRRRLLNGLKELDRYLETEGRSIAGRFAALIRRRDDLDYQFALQLRLRLWLVLHCVLSVALVSGGIVHAVMAWRFSG